MNNELSEREMGANLGKFALNTILSFVFLVSGSALYAWTVMTITNYFKVGPVLNIYQSAGITLVVMFLTEQRSFTDSTGVRQTFGKLFSFYFIRPAFYLALMYILFWGFHLMRFQ